jgi:predicted dehydrogenase
MWSSVRTVAFCFLLLSRHWPARPGYGRVLPCVGNPRRAEGKLMTTRHTVCLLGCGPRGEDHLHGFIENPDRFEVLAVCDRDEARANALAEKYGVGKVYADGDAMLGAERPDVFCFATMPDARLPLVELGIRHGVRAIALEKPLALSVAEARAIRDHCDTAGVQWVVSHQQKYGSHYRRVKEIVESGEIGEVRTIHVTAQAWLTQLGTHMMDYAIWLNGGSPVEWVIGQAHGAGRLSDSHPSPDHTCGFFRFANGVRGIAEFGPLAPSFLDDPNLFWVNDSMTAYGTHGYARMILGKGWEAVTRYSGGEVISGEGFFDPRVEQPLYLRDLADWLDDPAIEHPCSGRLSYHGFEASMAFCISSLERRQVMLPLDAMPDPPVFEQLQGVLTA